MQLRAPKVNKTVRTLVSVAVVATFLSVWLYKTYHGQSINPVTFTIVSAFALAAGYGVWGRMFDKAVEEAKEVQEGGGGDSDESDTAD